MAEPHPECGLAGCGPPSAILNRKSTNIAADDPEAAARASARIRGAAEHLADFPEMGRVGRVPSTRELVVARTP